MNGRLTCLLCTGAFFVGAAVARADEVLLFDDFTGPTLDTSTWGLANWNIGDKTQFGNSPVFSTDGEDGFHIYRTYKPKGRSQPDFNLVASTGANVTSFADSVVDSIYLYYVTAFNAGSESGQSNTIEVSVGTSHGSK